MTTESRGLGASRGREVFSRATRARIVLNLLLIRCRLTSIGLFFLPTLLVCSFSGSGSARLTGGLKDGADAELLTVQR